MDLASKNPTLLKIDEKGAVLSEGMAFCVAINELFIVKKVYPPIKRENLKEICSKYIIINDDYNEPKNIKSNKTPYIKLEL